MFLRVPISGWRRVLCAVAMAAVPGVALAHQGVAAAGGFLSGFMHPLAGVDHLLAMVAVGIWGAFLGAPLIYLLPVTFPLMMVVGAILGIAGIDLPLIEAGVALSVVALGAAIAGAWRAPVALAVAIVAFFAVFHGFAHGKELPDAADPAAYAAGFVLATGGLHLCGIALGLVRRLSFGAPLLRGAGVLIAALGIWILLSRVSPA
ncbi:MAG: HupE/UreJ family protein [Steroidobacteraceae bacterium]